VTANKQKSYWDIPLEDLTREVGEYTGMEWSSPKHAQRQLLGQILIARAFDASTDKQNQLVKGTWVLAVATIVLAIGALA
jgi:hypothetical protein